MILRWFALVLAGALLLTACGGDDPTRHNEFAPLTAIHLSATPSSLAPGTSVQVAAEGVFDGFSRPITDECTWESDAEAVATVGTTGRVKAVGTGTARITATRDGVVRGTLDVTVTNAAIVSVTLTPATISLSRGLTKQFAATGAFSDATEQDITVDAVWGSSDTAVATVSASGLATTLANGPSTISATFGSRTGTAALTVTEPVLQSIAVAPGSAIVVRTAPQSFTAHGTYDNGATAPLTAGITWRSSDDRIATIDSTTGVARGVAPGTVTITATAGTLTSTAQLTVAAPTRIDISQPAGTVLATTAPFTLTATAVFADNRTLDISQIAEWSPTATTGAASVSNTVGTKGRVTVHRTGTVNIQATLDGVTGTRPLTVSNGG